MRATTNRKELLELLSRVKSAAATRATLPVCQSVLIKAGQGKVVMTANNLEVALSGSCKADITKKGAVCAPPKPLEVFLKTVTAEIVTLTGKGKQLKVGAGNATTTLEGYEAKDFPPVPKIRGKGIVIENLAKALKEVDYAMAQEDSRPVLQAICFAPAEGGIELAAADGFRLGVATVKVKGNLKSQVIVPAAAIGLITKLMNGETTMRQSNGNISFEGNGLTLTTKATEGTYPDYKKLIPEGGTRLTVEVEEFRDALKIVMAIEPISGIVRLQTKGRTLIVSAKNEETGTTEVKLPAQGEVKIAFNGSYLKDILARVDGKMMLWTTTPSAPGVFKQNGTTHVLMPMFAQW